MLALAPTGLAHAFSQSSRTPTPSGQQNAPASFPLTSGHICNLMQPITNGYRQGASMSVRKKIVKSTTPEGEQIEDALVDSGLHRRQRTTASGAVQAQG